MVFKLSHNVFKLVDADNSFEVRDPLLTLDLGDRIEATARLRRSRLYDVLFGVVEGQNRGRSG